MYIHIHTHKCIYIYIYVSIFLRIFPSHVARFCSTTADTGIGARGALRPVISGVNDGSPTWMTWLTHHWDDGDSPSWLTWLIGMIPISFYSFCYLFSHPMGISSVFRDHLSFLDLGHRRDDMPSGYLR